MERRVAVGRAMLEREDLGRSVLEWGFQSELARALGVHRSTINRDMWRMLCHQPTPRIARSRVVRHPPLVTEAEFDALPVLPYEPELS